jgi:hypothetical protein
VLSNLYCLFFIPPEIFTCEIKNILNILQIYNIYRVTRKNIILFLRNNIFLKGCPCFWAVLKKFYNFPLPIVIYVHIKNFLVSFAVLCLLTVNESISQSWWSYSEVYEVFVRSFYDSDGDAVGDYKGLEQELDYLEDLGVYGIWLMPVFESPAWHGYTTNGEPWSPVGNNQDPHNVAYQYKKPGSLWSHYQKMIKLRGSYAEFSHGEYEFFIGNQDLLVFAKRFLNETILVILNTSDTDQNVMDTNLYCTFDNIMDGDTFTLDEYTVIRPKEFLLLR